MQETNQIKEDFKVSLRDLTFNCRNTISNLTTICQEAIHYAPSIVKAFEEHIFEAPPSQQIPVMYLVDSVLKFVGNVYRVEFAKIIVQIFRHSYSICSTEDTHRLRKMLDSWRNHQNTTVFPPRLIDECRDATTQSRTTPPTDNRMLPPMSNGVNMMIMNQIEILMSQKRAYISQFPFDTNAQSQLRVLTELSLIIQTTVLDVQSSQAITLQLQQMHEPIQQYPMQHHQQSQAFTPIQSMYSNQINTHQQQPLSYSQQFVPIQSFTHSIQTPITESLAPQSPNSLVSNLMKHGLLGLNIPDITPLDLNSTSQPMKASPSIVKKFVKLSSEDLQIKRIDLVVLLYDTFNLQCIQCAMRLVDNDENKKVLVDHLDWHFRQNRRLKDKKGFVSREWFACDDDWINERSQDQKLLPFQDVIIVPEIVELVKPSTVYSSVNFGAICGVCNEAFEKYWDEDNEEWMLRNTIVLNDGLVHYTCKNDTLIPSDLNLSKKRKNSDTALDSSESLKVVKVEMLESRMNQE